MYLHRADCFRSCTVFFSGHVAISAVASARVGGIVHYTLFILLPTWVELTSD